MNLTISVIKSIASRNVWSSDWTAPWCDAILFYKRGDYNHTHPLWQQYKEKVVRELNLTGTFDQYSTPAKDKRGNPTGVDIITKDKATEASKEIIMKWNELPE